MFFKGEAQSPSGPPPQPPTILSSAQVINDEIKL